MLTDIQVELARIYGRDGCVTPSAVVAEAESVDSPLHNQFEWNDDIAAHHYRLVQARTLIRKVRIVIEERPERLIHVPRLVDTSETREGEYKPMSVVVRNRSDFERARLEAERRLESAKRALDELLSAAATDGFSGIDGIRAAREALNVAHEALRLTH